MPGTLVHGRPHLVRRRHVARTAPPREEKQEEAPAWQAIVLMFVVVAFIAVTLITACFLAAKLATGHAV